MVLNKTQLRLYENCKGILLDDVCLIDANERIGLLSLIAGVRRVALFLGIEESDRYRLDRVFWRSDVRPVTVPGPSTAYTWESSHPPQIVRLFRKRDPKPALWLCREPKDVSAIKRGMDQIAVGRLLGYPECCIDAHQTEKSNFESAVIAAYIKEYGESPEQISDALMKNFKVQMEWEDDKRVPRTTARFPFVQHMACEACLNSESSPTATINSAYRQLVEGVDHHLYDYLRRSAERAEKHLRDRLRNRGLCAGQDGSWMPE